MAERVDAIAAGTARELVWLLEHPPLYTAGTSAKPSRSDRARALPRASHRPRRPVHLSRARTARRLRHARREAPLSATCAPTSPRWRRWIIDALAALGVAGERRSGPGRRLGAPAGAGRASGRTRSRPSACGCALGELARLQPQRARRTWRTSPASCRAASATTGSRAWPSSGSAADLDGASTARCAPLSSSRFGPTCDVAGAPSRRKRRSPRLERDSRKESAAATRVARAAGAQVQNDL